MCIRDRYEVNVGIKSIKYEADSLGNELTLPLNDWIDIGVIGKTAEDQDTFLYLQKHLINKEEMNFNITVDQKPVKAGIDPINKLIDRNSDDNIANVVLDN